MDKNDIRFVIRHAQDFIRQSGWTYHTTFTQNNKAVITATFDPRSRFTWTAGKLVKDLKILLAYPPFDLRFNILDDGSLFISINKSLTPKKSPSSTAFADPRQNKFTLPIYNHTRRKKDASDADSA